MSKILVDFSKTQGKIKPMHAVNNGPVYKWQPDLRITNIDHYKAVGHPYARLHDTCTTDSYGREFGVDVHRIFSNFDADPEDPASYIFADTDHYLKVIDSVGTKIYYHLAATIEHTITKLGTLPPKDFKKWAVICEHIIRHYTEGWANGFYYDIEYWEIWNEPDLDPDDATHKRCWGGTKAQFFEFYNVVAHHLKTTFPHLKIGGPAIAFHLDYAEEFLAQVTTPPDFFTWHRYHTNPEAIMDRAVKIRALLDKYGFTQCESHLNEWNYMRNFAGDAYLYSRRTIKSLKNAAFTASVMSAGQKAPLDMLMYYDARPCGFNGMYSTDFVCDRLKGYYSFYAFGKLYRMGEQVYSSDDENIYTCAAKGEDSSGIMITHYNDDDNAEAKTVTLEVSGSSAATATLYLLDNDHDLEAVETLDIKGDTTITLNMPNLTLYYIEFK
ncbi:MAG: hypothetical protein J6B93_00070 [Clostridia bacterium]|nr:hypothetical protein [Clostridia bacterium]